MQRRASLSLPTGRKTGAVDVNNVNSPFGDSHRTPCPVSHVRTPRKSSKVLGKDGSLYHSQENVCMSYIRKTSESNLFRPGHGLREPSTSRDSRLDASLVFSHPEPPRPPERRSRRAVSEDRSVEVGIGWRGTGGRSVSRQSSRSNLQDETFRFLPSESVNQEEPPRLILKRTPAGGSRINLYSDEKEMDGDQGNKSKLSSSTQALDITKREIELEELMKKLENIKNLIDKVEKSAETLLQLQTDSKEFQTQLKRETEGYDLQRGVYRVLDALDGDKREYGRLSKKIGEMQKRHSKGIFLDGENEELRSLALGVNDLEKKLLRSLDELERLRLKTQTLIDRQKYLEEQRRLKLEEEAKKNEALMALLKDSTAIDKLLKDLSYVKSEHLKAEHIHRKLQEKVTALDEDEMDTDEIILQRIGMDTQTTTDDLLRLREDIIKLQDYAIGRCDEEEITLDVVEEANSLRDKMLGMNQNVKQLKIDIEEFLKHQNESYKDLLKKMKDDEDRRKLEEEEDEERRKKLARDLHLLELEAEENRMRQKQEILQMLDGDMLELNKMKDQVLLLVGKQKKIKKNRRRRRQLPTIVEEDIEEEEEEEEEEADIADLMSRTNSLLSNIDHNENKILALRDDLDTGDDVMDDVRSLEDDIIKQSKTVQQLTQETDKLYDEEEKLLQLKNREAQDVEQRKKSARQSCMDLKSKYGDLILATEKIIDEQRDVGEIYKHLEDIGEPEIVELEQLMKGTLKYEQSLLDIQRSNERSFETDNVDDLEKHLDALREMFPEKKTECEDLQLKTKKLYNEAVLRLKEKQKNDNDKEKEKDTERLKSLEDNAKSLKSRHNDLELQLKLNNDDNLEDSKNKANDLEKLLNQKEVLQSIESNLNTISDGFQDWKDFQWTEEEEMELNKYGMISSLSIPSFPAGLIKDPALLQQIQNRIKKLQELRRRLAEEEQRLAEVNQLLEEMERAQRERELARLADQSKNWIHDFVPRGTVEFGSQPSFKSDFTVDPEEARAAAASRRASRRQSRESSVTPVETIGASKGYEEELLGYTARSRQQSLDRRSSTITERKQSTKQAPQAAEVKNSEPKPPTAPRRKRDK